MRARPPGREAGGHDRRADGLQAGRRARCGPRATTRASRRSSPRSASGWCSGSASARATRVLDVACGTGNVAIPAARAGGRVTGVDLTPEHFPAARARATAAGVDGRLGRGRRRGAPVRGRQLRRRALLLRLHVRPAPRGRRGRAGAGAAAGRAARRQRVHRRRRRRRLLPHARRPSARPAAVRGEPARLGRSRPTSAPSSPGSSSRSSRAAYAERFASLDHAVELYTTAFGPIVALGGDALAGDLRALFERHATDGGTRVPYEYLVTLSPTGPAAARRA